MGNRLGVSDLARTPRGADRQDRSNQRAYQLARNEMVYPPSGEVDIRCERFFFVKNREWFGLTNLSGAPGPPRRTGVLVSLLIRMPFDQDAL